MSEIVSKCEECSKHIGRNESFVVCQAFCRNVYCQKCTELSKYEMGLLNNKNILFVCDNCQPYIKSVIDKMDNMLKVVNENKMALIKQEEEIKTIIKHVKNLSEKETNVLEKKKTNSDMIKNVPPVIVKPKDNVEQNSEKTKEIIKESIDPADLALQISGVSKSGNGSVVIKCGNEESTKKIESQLKEKLGEKYNINIPSLVAPKIVIIGIDKEVSENNLLEVVKKQNKIEGSMKVVKCYERYQHKMQYNAIIETDSKLFRNILEVDKPSLNVGWNKCAVYDKISVKRCYKCWGYNHMAKDCTKNICCPKCSGEHKLEECNSEILKCKNCIMTIENLGMEINPNHDARDVNCPVYLRRMNQERTKFAY